MIELSVNELLKINPQMLQNKVICFPTDTVYGVGASIFDDEAISRIYQMKKRSDQKPLAILAAKVEDIIPFVEVKSPKLMDLMDSYWPGAMTIIFNKKPGITDRITSGLPTVGFRIPDSEIALKVLGHLGKMATTSVNISGTDSLNDIEEIKKQFGNDIDFLINDPCQLSAVPSTVIDATTNEIKVLRQGEIKINV
jgi:L-threonylcarbamoyladenylate synthase